MDIRDQLFQRLREHVTDANAKFLATAIINVMDEVVIPQVTAMLQECDLVIANQRKLLVEAARVSKDSTRLIERLMQALVNGEPVDVTEVALPLH